MSGKWIDRLVEPGAIRVLFQPIVDLRLGGAALHSVEGLSRGPRGTNLEAPDVLFEYARRKNDEALVDRAAVGAILGQASALSAGMRIQVNVHASTIARDSSFGDFLIGCTRAARIAPPRLTVEILEQSNPVDEVAYVRALDRLREGGFSIALDDVGVGTSSLRMILLTRPSMLKLDRVLIDGIAADPYQRTALRAVQLLAEQARASVVAEGVEREEDLIVLRELGVEFAQGYFFSRPRAASELSGMSVGDPLLPPELCRSSEPAALAAAG